MKVLIKQFSIMAVIFAIAQAQSPVGVPVIGVLNDAAQKEVAGAYVILGIVPAAAPAVTTPFFATTITGRDGRFRFDNVPAGEFRICTQTPGKKFLNACDWSDKAPTIKTDGKAAANAGRITVEEGYLLEVDVNHLQKALNSNLTFGALASF